MHVNSDLEGYISALVHATRVDRRVAVGASPRGSSAFAKMGPRSCCVPGREVIFCLMMQTLRRARFDSLAFASARVLDVTADQW